MVCDGLQCFQKLKIAGKWPISLHRVAGPYEIYTFRLLPLLIAEREDTVQLFFNGADLKDDSVHDSSLQEHFI